MQNPQPPQPPQPHLLHAHYLPGRGGYQHARGGHQPPYGGAPGGQNIPQPLTLLDAIQGYVVEG